MTSYGAIVRHIQQNPTAPGAAQLAARLGARGCMLRAVELARQGLRASARDELARAVERAPADAVVLVSAGLVAYVCRDHERALSLFDRAAAAGGGWPALRLKFERASALSWKHEAREAIDAGIVERSPEQARWHVEALSLFSRYCVFDLAIQHGQAAAQLRPDVPAVHMELAHVYCRLDDVDATRRAVERALELRPDTLEYCMEAAQIFIRIGCFAEAREALEAALHLEAHSAAAHEALGSLALWSGCDDEAEWRGRRALECNRSFAPAARLLGACARMRGDMQEARRRFQQALWLDPHEAEAHAFCAELALEEGRIEDAQGMLSRAVAGARGYMFAGHLLYLLAAVLERNEKRFSPGRIAHFIKGVSELCPELAARLAEGDVDLWEQAIRAALPRMRGNRSTTPTYLAGDRLTLLRPGSEPRFESRRALETIAVCHPEESLAALDAVVQGHPVSSLPLAHKGELLVWLGDLPAARATLEQAIALEESTRWAYIGLTAIDVLEGNPERALETSARGVAAMHNTEGPAVYVIRGEALRILGRLAEAERDLERACALHPSRISATINLGLLRVAQGDTARARELFERLERRACGLVCDAAREERIVLHGDSKADLSLDTMGRLFGRMLAMLRGNRSSTCITYFTASGRLRTVHQLGPSDPGPHALDTDHLERARTLVERALGVSALPVRVPIHRSKPVV